MKTPFSVSRFDRNAPTHCQLPGVYTGMGCRVCPFSHECTEAETQPAAAYMGGIMRDKPLPAPAHAGPQLTVVVIDRSGSMGSDDYPPTRLAAAKQAASEYVKARAEQGSADRIAVVSFGTGASLVCELRPLLGNEEAVMRAIDKIQVSGWTSIGVALAKTEKALLGRTVGWVDRFLGSSSAPGIVKPGFLERVILLTDGGHNHGQEPLPVAERLKKSGVLIDCIGIGARKEVDEGLLRKIASRHGGQPRYRFIADKNDLLDQYRRLGGSITR